MVRTGARQPLRRLRPRQRRGRSVGLVATIWALVATGCGQGIPAACTDLADEIATPIVALVDRNAIVDQLDDEALRGEIELRRTRTVDELLAEAGENGYSLTPENNSEAADLLRLIDAASEAGCTLEDLAPTLARRFERAAEVPFIGHPDRLERLAGALRFE